MSIIHRVRAFIGSIFDLSRYPSGIDRERARTIYWLTSLMLIGGSLMVPFTRDPLGRTTLERVGESPAAALSIGIMLVGLLAVVGLVRRGRLNAAAFILSVAWLIGVGGGAAAVGMYNMPSGAALVAGIMLPGLLLGRWGLLIGFVMAVITTALGLAARATIPRPDTYDSTAEFVTVLPLVALIMGFVYLFQYYSRVSHEEGANAAAADRFRLAEITSQITQRISGRMDLDDVLNSAVHEIITHYPNIYHAQIFLVGEDDANAGLVASTGEAGRKLLDQRHSLAVGSASVIGRVTATGEPVIARARGSETVHRANEYLPDTQAEAAFPLRSGGRIIGALDLQSKSAATFPERDISIFQALADHLAIAIDNARLFEQAEQRFEENRRLAEQANLALEEVERLNRRLTTGAWSEYLQRQNTIPGVLVDLERGLSEHGAPPSATLLDAIRADDIVRDERLSHTRIAVPLRVRGQVIGALEFELDRGHALATDDLELVQQISERLGLAVENVRLYEESQRAAQREALINEISTHLQATTNVETTLNEAALSLRRTLSADRVAIRLGPPPAANGNGSGK